MCRENRKGCFEERHHESKTHRGIFDIFNSKRRLRINEATMACFIINWIKREENYYILLSWGRISQFAFSPKVWNLFCFKNMSQNSCFVCQGLKLEKLDKWEGVVYVVMVCFQSCTISMFKMWMREPCCIKFRTLSCHLWLVTRPKEHSWECPQSHPRKAFGNVPWGLPS